MIERLNAAVRDVLADPAAGQALGRRRHPGLSEGRADPGGHRRLPAQRDQALERRDPRQQHPGRPVVSSAPLAQRIVRDANSAPRYSPPRWAARHETLRRALGMRAWLPLRFYLTTEEIRIARSSATAHPNRGKCMTLEPGRAKPKPTPETNISGTAPRPASCGCSAAATAGKAYFPPRPFCPDCGSRNVAVFKASGKAQALLLRDPPPPGAGLHAALRDRGRGARGRPAHDDQHRRLPADARGAGARHAARGRLRADGRRRSRCPCSGRRRREARMQARNQSPSSAPPRPPSSASSPDLSQIGCTPTRR